MKLKAATCTRVFYEAFNTFKETSLAFTERAPIAKGRVGRNLSLSTF